MLLLLHGEIAHTCDNIHTRVYQVTDESELASVASSPHDMGNTPLGDTADGALGPPSRPPAGGVGRSPTFDNWHTARILAVHPSAPVSMCRLSWCMADYRHLRLLQSDAGCSVYRVRGVCVSW